MKKYLIIAIFIGIGLLSLFTIKHSKKPSPDKKILHVAANFTFPPFTYIENGQMAGFDVDLMNEIAREINAEIEWKSLPFDALLPGLQTGIFPIAVGGITPTAERTRNALFTNVYHTGDPLLIVCDSSSSCYKTLDDLKGKTVIVNEGYNADLYLSTISEITLLRLETAEEAFLALKAKRAEAFVAARDSVMPYLRKYGIEHYCVNTIPDTNDSAAICISKKHSHLLYEINNALDKIIQKGIVAQLKQKWKLS